LSCEIIDIDINQLDDNDFFRSSFNKDNTLLSDSIKKTGQLNPIWVRELSKDRYQIINGFQRTQILNKLGANTIKALIFTGDDAEDKKLAYAAFHENLVTRGYGLIEKAMAAKALLAVNNNDVSDIMNNYSIELGIKKSSKQLNDLLGILELDDGWLNWISEKNASLSAANLIKSVDGPDQKTLYNLVKDIRPNPNILRELVPLLCEISGRENLSVRQIIESLNVSYDKETDQNLLRETVMKKLRTRRSPEKELILDEIEKVKTALDLPQTIALVKAEKLDPLTLNIHIKADSTDAIKKSAEKLEECADNESLKNLFEKFGK